MAAGVYFVIGVLIAAALWVVSEFQSNVVQQWMAQSKLGKLSMEDKFPSLLDQRTALIKIANG
ncbi:hypothetical protein [Burkholderia ubonensis]|nr:hypothetical protein [Burkholderia ubonensis]